MMNSTSIDLYIMMKKIRMVEEAIATEYPNRQMHTPIHLYIGQEAIAAGVCQNLRKDDNVVSNHRSHGHYIAKGGNLDKMIAELYNKETGCCKGRGGSMHLYDSEVNFSLSSSIVAGGIPIGVGLGLSSYIKGSDNVSVIFLGDAASEEGCVYESICFAKLMNLPVIFICENNMYSICTGLKEREPVDNVKDKFSNILPTALIDGNNVEEVYNIVGEALERARNGEGPSFIECKTYRLRDHHNVNTGVELGYRTQEEWNYWNEKSPITAFENKLIGEGVLNSEIISEIENNINEEIQKAFIFAKESELPKKEEVELYVYSEVK